MNVVNSISEGHDIDVQEWCDNLRTNIPDTETTPSVSAITICNFTLISLNINRMLVWL